MKEILIVLGAGVMQGPAIRTASEMGLYTVAVDADDKAPCVSLADRFEKIDLKDKEGIAALGLALQKEGPLGGIMTAGTDFSASVAWAAERLGLPGIPYEAALNASDKERMRRRFSEAGLPSPAFIVLDAVPAAADLPGSYPLVVKPVDNMGGRGCRRASNFDELREAVGEALRFSRSRRAIVEAYMEGPEFSADAIVYHGEITICGLADRHIFFPPCFIEMGHTMPTTLEPEKQEALLAVFRAGIRALGIAGAQSGGAAKGDLKLTSSGPMIGEIAARLSGGYMSGWTYPYASGVNPLRGAILAALGRKPEGLVPAKNWTSAERAFISIPGTVRSIQGREDAGSLPHIKDIFMRAAAGGAVKFPENNVTKCGNVISAAPDRETAAAAAERAARSVLIRLEAPDRETAEFLTETEGPGGPERFPPDAFQISPELRLFLAELPPDGGTGGKHPAADIRILPFPEFQASGLRDYMGRTVEESLRAVRDLTGIPLPAAEKSPANVSDNKVYLGRSFWAALIRGGYQGAAYVVDSLTAM
ncbi:MAG: ATP-grasp domain-containing protein [Treponema sp.]|jgi:biotin carboxylase|nr:ATP-grasp domain-containing protein [Treponema sp.]